MYSARRLGRAGGVAAGWVGVGAAAVVGGPAFSADTGGEGVEADRPACEVVDDDGKQAAVEVVETEAVDGE